MRPSPVTATSIIVSGSVERATPGETALPPDLRIAVECHDDSYDGGGVLRGQFPFTLTPNPQALAANTLCSLQAVSFGWDWGLLHCLRAETIPAAARISRNPPPQRQMRATIYNAPATDPSGEGTGCTSIASKLDGAACPSVMASQLRVYSFAFLADDFRRLDLCCLA
jgi:hypothetical protein